MWLKFGAIFLSFFVRNFGKCLDAAFVDVLALNGFLPNCHEINCSLN
jgi:hypothetical protein